jgi:hypothetical protein
MDPSPQKARLPVEKHRPSEEEVVESLIDGWRPVFVSLDVADSEADDPLSQFAPERPAITNHQTPGAPSPANEIVQPREQPDAVIAAAPMTVARVSLADILASDMPMHWFEVIAIAQSVCLAMLETSETAKSTAPPLWHVVITSLGTVEITAGIDAEGSPTSLLRRILETGAADHAPVWFRLALFLLKPWFRIATLRGLFVALEVLERPGRSKLIRAVVDRYFGPRAAEAGSAQTKPVLVRPGPQLVRPRTTAVEGPVPIVGRSRPGFAAAAAVLAIVGSLVFDVWWLREASVSTRSSVAERPFLFAPAGPDWTSTSGPQAFMRRLGLISTRPHSSNGRPYIFDASRTGSRKTLSHNQRARAAAPTTRLAARTPEPLRRQLVAASALSATPAAVGVQADEPPDAARLAAPSRIDMGGLEATNVVYDSHDIDVTPPVELSSYRTIRVPRANLTEEVASIELVIDEAGTVRSVALLQPVKRWDEVMLLSAIKARRFQPATRNDHPVKYRTRILVGASQDQRR